MSQHPEAHRAFVAELHHSCSGLPTDNCDGVVAFTTNIAFAGLTAAGKTTHAKRLAFELGYDYVSATEIMLEILNIRECSDQIWFTRFDEIQAAREGNAVDIELEKRLENLARTRQKTIFDTWALAWISKSPMVRIWIESDFPSRVRKCVVSQSSELRSFEECRELVQTKDETTRSSFLRRHGFDLYRDRRRYHAVLCNSHLIPNATKDDAKRGIESFAPVVHAATISVMASDEANLNTLRLNHSQEVLSIKPMGRA